MVGAWLFAACVTSVTAVSVEANRALLDDRRLAVDAGGRLTDANMRTVDDSPLVDSLSSIVGALHDETDQQDVQPLTSEQVEQALDAESEKVLNRGLVPGSALESEEDPAATEQPAAEQPAAEQPAAEQPAAEQPAAEQPAAEQPAAEQPAAAPPAAEQPAAEQPAAEQPAAEQPAAEQPAAEQPAGEEKPAPAPVTGAEADKAAAAAGVDAKDSTVVVVNPNEDQQPEPPAEIKEASKKDFENKFDSGNPLTQHTIFETLGIPIVVGLVASCILVFLYLIFGSKYEDIAEDAIELPENMYGETVSTVLCTSWKGANKGWNPALMCETLSSLLLLAVTYCSITIMLQVALATIDSVASDTEERDSAFTKFRDPEIWQAQNWEVYPDTVWRRESMVWYCHDIIYGKVRHVNQLGPTWSMFSWVVLVVWFMYMLIEARESAKMYSLCFSVPTLNVKDMIEIDEKEDKIKVHGIARPLKFFLLLIVVIPKAALNAVVTYIGAIFLLYNDLDDDLQDILLKTIEMAFILEMDELIYEAFSSHSKKQQLPKIDMPPVTSRGFWRIVGVYGEFPRFVGIIVVASMLAIYMNTDAKARSTLTPRESGIIEGCCNFLEYLKGAGHPSELAPGNPCSAFRETYEAEMAGRVPEGGYSDKPADYTAPTTPEGAAAPAAPAAAATALVQHHVPAAVSALLSVVGNHWHGQIHHGHHHY